MGAFSTPPLSLFMPTQLAKKAPGSKQAQDGVIVDNFDVLLEQFGVVLDNNGVIPDKLGNTNEPKNSI